MRLAIAVTGGLVVLGCALEEPTPERERNLDEPYTLEVAVGPRFIDISPLLPARCHCDLAAWPAPGQCAVSSDAPTCSCDDDPGSSVLPWTCVTAVRLLLNDGDTVVTGEPPQPFGRVVLPEDWRLESFEGAVLELTGCEEPVRLPLVTSPRRLELTDVVGDGDEVALYFEGDPGGESLLFSEGGSFGAQVCREPYALDAPVHVPPTDSLSSFTAGVRGLWLDDVVPASFGEVRLYRSAGFFVRQPILPAPAEAGRWQFPVPGGLFEVEGAGTPPDGTPFSITSLSFDPAATAPEHTLLVVGQGFDGSAAERLTYAMGPVEDEVRLETPEGAWSAVVPHLDVEGVIRPGTAHTGPLDVETMLTLQSLDGTQPDREVELRLSLFLPPIARLP